MVGFPFGGFDPFAVEDFEAEAPAGEGVGEFGGTVAVGGEGGVDGVEGALESGGGDFCCWGGDWVMALRCQRRTAARAAVVREAAAANDSRGGGRLEGGEEALMVADRRKARDG